MGEIAEGMMDGTLCEGCGVYMGAPGGFPVRCKECQDEHPREGGGPAKCKCPQCGKRVKVAGLKDHIRDVHGGATPELMKALKDCLEGLRGALDRIARGQYAGASHIAQEALAQFKEASGG